MRKMQRESKFKFSGVGWIEDILPRKGRFGQIYIVVYLQGGGTVIASEDWGNLLAIGTVYIIKGSVTMYKGGVSLRAKEFTEVNKVIMESLEIKE